MSVVGRPCSSLAHPSGMDGVAATLGQQEAVAGDRSGGDVEDDRGMAPGGDGVGERVGREHRRDPAVGRHHRGPVLHAQADQALLGDPTGVDAEGAQVGGLAHRHGGHAMGPGPLDHEVDGAQAGDLAHAQPGVEPHGGARVVEHLDLGDGEDLARPQPVGVHEQQVDAVGVDAGEVGLDEHLGHRRGVGCRDPQRRQGLGRHQADPVGGDRARRRSVRCPLGRSSPVSPAAGRSRGRSRAAGARCGTARAASRRAGSGPTPATAP